MEGIIESNDTIREVFPGSLWLIPQADGSFIDCKYYKIEGIEVFRPVNKKAD